MADHYNNNLGDFFRKKLSEKENIEEGWERPDDGVRERILNEIYSEPKVATFDFSKIWKVTLLLFILALLGYVYVLKNQKNELNDVIQAQAEKLENIEKDNSDLKNKFKEKEASVFADVKKSKKEKKELTFINEKLTSELKQQKSITEKLILKNEELNEEVVLMSKEMLEMKKEELVEEINNKENEETVFPNDEIKTVDLLPIKPFENTIAEISPLKSQWEENNKIIPLRNNNRQRFSIGYEFARMEAELPVKRQFLRQRIVSNDETRSTYVTNSNGIYVAYSPLKKLKIRSGARFFTVNSFSEFNSGLIYNKSGEYQRPNGRTGNQLAFFTDTPYGTTVSRVDIEVPEDEPIEDGDFLEVSISDKQSMHYMQIPIGLEYLYGTGRLKFVFQGGFQFNRIDFGEYYFEAALKNKNREIVIDKKLVVTKEVPPKTFMSTYAGLGLDFNLYNHWHATASFTYHKNPSSKIKNRFSNTSNDGTAFALGLNYVF